MKSYLDGHIPDVSGFITEDVANARFETIAEHEAFAQELIQRITSDESNISLKANTADVYSKETVDSKLDLKANVTDMNSQLQTKANSADVYNKTETDAKLDIKANSEDVYVKDDVYNKTELDSKVSTLNQAIVTVATAVDTKANAADVYTNSETYDRNTIHQLIDDAAPDPEVEYVTRYSPDAKWEMFWDTAGFVLGLADTTLHCIDIATGRVAGPYAVISSLKTIGTVCASTLKLLKILPDEKKDPEEEEGKVVDDIVTDEDYYNKKNDTKSDLDQAVVAFKTLIDKYYNKDDVYTKDEADDRFAPKQDTRGPILYTFTYAPEDYKAVAESHYTEEQLIDTSTYPSQPYKDFAIDPFISELHYNSDPKIYIGGEDGQYMWKDYLSEEPYPNIGWMPLCTAEKSELYDNPDFVSEYNFRFYFDFGTNNHSAAKRYSYNGIDSIPFKTVRLETIIDYDATRAWFEASNFYIVDLNNCTPGFEHLTVGSSEYDIYCKLKPTVIQTGSGDIYSPTSSTWDGYWQPVFSDQKGLLVYFSGDCRYRNTATDKQFVIWTEGNTNQGHNFLFHSLLKDIQNGVEFGGDIIYPYNIKRDIREYYDVNSDNIQSIRKKLTALEARVHLLENSNSN